MKHYKEVILNYNKYKTEKDVVMAIDDAAAKMFEHGWYFENSKIDSTFEKIYLFFYKYF